MSDLVKAQPEFTAAIRGYDRLQVDDYVEQLHGLVAEAEERSRAAEDDLEFSRHATVGPRVSEIFDLAVAESQELRERVKAEAGAMLANAREEAEQLVSAAQREAAELRERTQSEHDDLLDELEIEREAAQARLVALEERRTRLMEELKRLHDALGSAAGFLRDADGLGDADMGGEAASTRELTVPRSDTDGRASKQGSSDRARAAG
jgi:cell division septum initiation protein DivIVA